MVRKCLKTVCTKKQLTSIATAEALAPLTFFSSQESLSVDFEVALNDLLETEKQSRADNDLAANSAAMLDIVELCVANRKWHTLRETVFLLTKKPSPLKQSIQKLVRECMRHLSTVEEPVVRTKIIEDLRTVTEGKIFLEIERAELSEMLADIKEAEGNLVAAADIMGELKIETFGSLDMRKKVEYLLHQMRLYIASQQNDIAQVLSKKIQTKFLNEKDNVDLKKLYYEMKIELEKESQYLNTCRYYLELITIAGIPMEQKQKLIVNAVIFCILAPFDDFKNDIMINLRQNEVLKQCDTFWKILEYFAQKELINFKDFCRTFAKDLNQVEMLSQSTALGQTYWAEMKKRLIEHNIVIISQYYTRIHLKRYAELLGISELVCEEYITRLVAAKTLFAKIDRFSGIVRFSRNQNAEKLLNDWTDEIHLLMKRVNRASHEINKEFCTHANDI